MENNNNIEEKLQNNEIIEENLKEPLLSFEYDIKNEEEDIAFTIFQKKYVYKRNWKITILFSLLAVMFILSIFIYGMDYLKVVLGFLSIAMIFITWYNTFRIKKYLLRALKTLEDDRYIFSLYDDSFKIETVISDEEKNSEDYVPIKPKIVEFSESGINIIEREDMFIIIIQKETIYVLPKRHIDKNSSEIIKDKLSEAFKDNYESEDKIKE